MEIRESVQFGAPTKDLEGKAWEVVLIERGFNKSKQRYYTDEALESIVALAGDNTLQCMVDHPGVSDSKDRPEGTIKDVVGWYTNVHLNETGNAVMGTLNLLSSDSSPLPHLSKAMKEAYTRGNKNLFELSIRGSAEPKAAVIDGHKTMRIGRLTRLASTDLVTRGGAHGRILNILASDRDEGDDKMSKDLIEVLKDVPTEDVLSAITSTHPNLLKNTSGATEGKPVREAVTVGTNVNETPIKETNAVDGALVKLGEAERRYSEAVAAMEKRAFVAEAKARVAEKAGDLTVAIKTRLSTWMADGRFNTKEAVDTAIKEEQSLYETVMAGAAPLAQPMVRFTGKAPEAEITTNEKITRGIVAYLKGAKDFNGVRAYRNIKEAYWDWQISQGRKVNIFSEANTAANIIREANRGFDPMTMEETEGIAGLNEALAEGDFSILESITSSSFSVLLGAAMHKVFVDAYTGLQAKYGDWQKLVSDRITVTDFKNYNFTRKGVYNSLPAVAEGGTYQALTSPTEENVILAVTKFGGTEDLTMESIANDDLNALTRIPRDLALAAAIGRYRAVFDLLVGTGATMDYDSTVLFHTDHANTGTTALSGARLHADWMSMMQQNALSATEADMFLKPRYVVVPVNLNLLAWQLYRNTTEHFPTAGAADAYGVNNVNPVAGLAEPITVPYWTDTTNWYLVSDPMEAKTIAFATLAGHEEPQILLQNDPQVGSNYSADKVTIKVRDIRNQDVIDHRSFYGEIVA